MGHYLRYFEVALEPIAFFLLLDTSDHNLYILLNISYFGLLSVNFQTLLYVYLVLLLVLSQILDTP